MNTKHALALSVGAAVLAAGSAALAGQTPVPVGAPAPLLGAGLPGLAILVTAGAGYVAMRLRGRGKD